MAEVIGVDWGTSNIRAWRIDLDSGAVLDRASSATRLISIPRHGFSGVLRSLVRPWRSPGDLPVVMSGMVGSRQGWIETPYLDCPVEAGALSGRAVAIPGEPRAWILPGLRVERAEGSLDVMRGEEIQVFGCIGTGRETVRLCLPGTHSKWAVVEKGSITDFRTVMTGEAFAALRDHTILGATMSAPQESGEAFDLGIERSGTPGGLLHHLFSVRTEGLFDRQPASSLSDYLSGLLIGHELRHMSTLGAGDGTILLIGAPDLVRRYRAAGKRIGISMEPRDAEATTVAGLAAVARNLLFGDSSGE